MDHLSDISNAVKRIAELESEKVLLIDRVYKANASELKAHDRIKDLEAENANLKCCGNCAHTDPDEPRYCENTGYLKNKNQRCEYWQFDNLTQKERMI